MLDFSKKILVLFSFSIFTILFNIQPVIACSCAEKPTVLESYESANIIVETKLVSVEKFGAEKDRYERREIKSIKMVVDKVYKGNVKVGDKLIIGQGDGVSCAMTFDEKEIGKKMLFYLNESLDNYQNHRFDDKADAKNLSYVSFCGRSNYIEGATDDLLFLKKLDKVLGKTRISGTIYGWKDELNTSEIDVKIIGKDKTFQVKTDKNGVYEIYDLPVGKYTIEPQIPKGWKIADFDLSRSPSAFLIIKKTKYNVSVSLSEQSHVGIDFAFVFDNSISGKVLSPSGEPMKNVRVSAIQTDSDKLDSWGYADSTNEKGEFVIETISPGKYNLVVNGDGKIDNDEPFGALFYPGVSDRENAGIVLIELNKFIENIVIQIPQTVDLIQIKGKLLYSDGKPVAEEDIKFIPIFKDKYDEISTESDNQGNFSLKIPKQAKGILFGDMYVYVNKFKNCEKLEQIIKEKGDNYFDITTNKLEIDAEENLLNINLIFPFPKCEKSKD